MTPLWPAALPSFGPVANWAPWTDRRGRLHPLRAAVFTLLTLPAAWLAVRWAGSMLGARPITAAIHVTGYWAAWILIAALVVTPAKAVLAMPNIVVVRRMIGNASLCYAAVHLLLYITDQNWRLLTVANEILVRFYLTIGFVVLLGLGVLGATSSDGWVKRLGRNWKRLHKAAYVLTALAMVHFFLQSKADVTQASIAAGVLAWLLLWRVLPAGRDRGPVPLIGLALAAAVMTLLFEWAWYRFGTKIDPMRVLRGELNVAFGLRPGGMVLLLGLLVAAAAELRTLSQTRFGASAGYTMLIYSLGALADDVIGFAMGWSMDDVVPEGDSVVALNVAWFMLFALLGFARHRLRLTWQRRLVDALWALTALSPLLAMGAESRQIGLASAAVLVAGALLLSQRLWAVSRGSAILVIPLAVLAACKAFALL